MIGKLNRNFLHEQSEPPHSVFHLIYFTFIFYYVHGCLAACLSLHYLNAVSERPEEGAEFPGTGDVSCHVDTVK